MATALSFSITAEDQTAKALESVNKRIADFQARTQRSMSGVEKRMEAVKARFDAMSARMGAFASGAAKVAGGFREIARAGTEAYQRVGQLVPVLGVLTSAATVAGVSRMSTAWADWGRNISNTAHRIGMAGSRLSALQGASALAGSTGEAMTAGLQGIGQAMYDAAGGRNTNAAVMIRTLQLTNAEMSTSESALMAVADRVQRMRNPYAQSQAMSALNIPDELLPAMRKGAAGIREYMAVARRLNPVTDEMIERAGQLHEAQSRVGQAVEGLRNRIAEKLEPILTPMLTHFADWLAKSPAVARGIEWLGDAVGRLGHWIEGIDWEKVSQRLDDWGKKLTSFLQLMQRIGILPDLSGTSDGKAPATSPTGKGFGENGAPTAPPPRAGTEDNGWLNWGRNFAVEANPLHWTPWYHPPMHPGANAPNGVPRVGPLFGPQQQRGQQADPAPEDRAYKPIMDLIGRAEGTDRGRGYNETLGYGKWTNGNVDLTHMTLDQIDTLQQSMLDKQGNNPNRSSALGRYQFTQTTLREMRQQFGLRGDQLFDEKFQDHLVPLRLQMSGGLTHDHAAGIWASLPDRATGQSHVGQRTGATNAELDDAIAAVQKAQASGAPMQPPQAQGAPMQLNSGNAVDGGAFKGGEIHFRVSSDQGSRARLMENTTSITIEPPLVERPRLLGAQP